MLPLSLHNVETVSSRPLLIYMPPHGYRAENGISQIPPFCRKYPTAVINYRWAGFPHEEKDVAPEVEAGSVDPDDALEYVPVLNWPLPIHDTLRAYSWIVENLPPPEYKRRSLYVYGSFLGASLATSLALTESHPHQRMAVRGFVAYNGVYNWTTFLPDHPINKQKSLKETNILEEVLGCPVDPELQALKDHAENLFGRPSYLFDPFASPCLFFQTSGLLVPQEFNTSADPVVAMLNSATVPAGGPQEAVKQLLEMMANKAPRRSPLAFPPRKSTLKIPETLLLHTPPLEPPMLFQKKRQRRKKQDVAIHFSTQANELASLMRRSLEKLEFKERENWDENFDRYDETDKRIKVKAVGLDESPFTLSSQGQMDVNKWLDDRMLVGD
ncbi:hypothetical protein BX600DRAFT_462205 [Xylariales sp. PMI_506]|nr:hypothetical protein BX600DRAFT_462205 [Xylariales sp. PMI_506]